MKNKIFTLVPLFIFPLCLTSCNRGVKSLPFNPLPKDKKAEAYNGSYKLRRENSILADGFFRNGFDVCERTNGPGYKGVVDHLTYNGNRETDYVKGETRFGNEAYWNLCQWWTANPIENATCTYEDYSYKYIDDSHLFSINMNNGEMKMHVNAAKEYQTEYGHQIINNGNWSHFLLEQWFPKQNRTLFAEQEKLNKRYHFRLDVTLDKSEWIGSEPANESQTGQLLMTFILGKMTRDSSNVLIPSSDSKDWMWFQIPIYDPRYDVIPNYHAQDGQQPGASTMYIYGLNSSAYMPLKRLQPGQTHCFDLDFTSDAKIAFEEAKAKNYLKDVTYEQLGLWYFNFGYEMPNNSKIDCGYNVGVTLNNFDLYLS